MSVPWVDRRKTVRAKTEFLLHLHKGKKEKMGKTVDLSACRMCCETQDPLPLFDEMEIKFRIPIGLKGKQEKNEWVSCKGVVVRCESVPLRKKFRVAFYFTECDPTSRHKIETYVKRESWLTQAA